MGNIYVNGSGRDENYITFYLDIDEALRDYDNYERFIKGCEHAVRKDDRYIAYIAKLKSQGLDKCTILGNIEEDDTVKLEMHHGPIFNLFDICDVVTRALIKRKEKKITTMMVGDLVLTEHEKDHIQVVMLSKSPHKGGHFNIFIHTKASFGRLDKFLDEYSDGVMTEHIQYIERYIEQCKQSDGTVDNGLFDTAKKLKSFK